MRNPDLEEGREKRSMMAWVPLEGDDVELTVALPWATGEFALIILAFRCRFREGEEWGSFRVLGLSGECDRG